VATNKLHLRLWLLLQCRTEKSHLNSSTRANEEDALTYMQTTERLRNYLAQMVNRTMAMHQLLGIKQGSHTWG